MTDVLSFGPLRVLSTTSLERLLAGSQRATFHPREVLVREGDRADFALAIVAGRVRITQGSPPILLASPTSPVLVGEMAIVARTTRNATVTAITHARGYRIPAKLLRDAMAEEPEFERELSAFAAVRAGNNFLRRSSPFADLPSATIEALAATLEPATFSKGDVLMSEGEAGDDAYLLREGDVEVLRGERRLATLGPGSFVGEVSVLTRTKRTATVRARGDVKVFRLRGDDVRPIIKRHQDLVARPESTMQSRHTPRHAGEVVVAPAPDDPDAVLLRDEIGSAYLRVTRDALAIYRDIDGEHTLRDLAMRHFDRTGALDPAGVFATVATLQAAGLVTAPRVASDEPEGRILRALDLLLAPRVELADADGLATALHRVFGWAFTTRGAVAGIVVGAVGLLALLRVFRQSDPSDFGLAGILVAFAGLLVAGIGHEAAHAIATKVEGRRIGRAGIGLIWFTPVVYVDTSDAWLVAAQRRIRVNAAGPLFNFALAGLASLAALVLNGQAQDLAIWLAFANLLSVAFNLSPLLEFDGYYVLEDLTRVNALRRKALRFVFSDLLSGPRRPLTRLERGFLVYAAGVVAYVLVMTIVVLAGVPALVNGMLEGRVPSDFIPLIGGGLALGMTALLVMPFVNEVVAARSAAD
ncbi:MAG: cyclic nucleotide-binding domain-containing protein [Chloroflexi bacterium]|nr:MAG: cyclic nucleotide-binding domain-containing protein [Chloroflexota bacterium]